MGKDFTSLEIYSLAEDLIIHIYKITKDFPKEEIYGITSQIKRAVISIALNIAEGYGRFHYKDFRNYSVFSKNRQTIVILEGVPMNIGTTDRI